ncbi:MAG: lipocalin-like domain-containing protein [Syntrophobacteraceae bacterium]
MCPRLHLKPVKLTMRTIKPDRENINLILAMCFLAAVVLCQFQIASAADYPAVSGPCNFSFPRDHASHPDYRIEWWYYTGNLCAEDGSRYGFQLTFFRVGTVPANKERPSTGKPSAWRADQVIVVHAALSDISSKEFLHSDKMSRAALGLAGAREADGRFEIFIDGCNAAITPALHHLGAKAADFSFSLDLAALKGPVAHGDAGWSMKGEGPGEASCYYSISRLEVSGNVAVGGRERPVRGTAWMDHEFSSAPLNPRFAGWDWFGLQFSDGTELMVYLMREKNGKYGMVSSGTFVDREGKPARLFSGDFRLLTLKTWKSPHSGALYPASWLLEVIPLDLRIKIIPNLADQEMQTARSTHITYWEGSVRAEGSGAQGRAVDGEGYAELTGYAGAVWF